MGKFDNKRGISQTTRKVRQEKTRKIGSENTEHIVPGHRGGDDVYFNREQLRAREKLERIPPTTTVFQPHGERGTLPDQPAPDASGKSGDRTVVYRQKQRYKSVPSQTKHSTPAPEHVIEEDQGKEADQPVVAWLVITEGLGRGHALTMSYGLNKIGRNSDQELPLDFGDLEISRDHHAAIEYDPKERSFYLSKGENLVYLNDKRVGLNSERPIETGDVIAIGSTKLKFVAFCGPDFDWSG